MSDDLLPHIGSSVLRQLPDLERLHSVRILEDGFIRFEGSTEEKSFPVIFLHLVSSDDQDSWQSARQLVDYAADLAKQRMRGLYGLDIFSLEIRSKLDSFIPSQYAELLINHSRLMQPGENRLISYQPFYGILKKRVNEDWGKMDVKMPVKIYREEPAKLDLVLKKAVKLAGTADAMIVIHDLSEKPVFRFGSEEQTTRLQRFLERSGDGQNRPCFYMMHAGHLIELTAQFSLR